MEQRVTLHLIKRDSTYASWLVDHNNLRVNMNQSAVEPIPWFGNGSGGNKFNIVPGVHKHRGDGCRSPIDRQFARGDELANLVPTDVAQFLTDKSIEWRAFRSGRLLPTLSAILRPIQIERSRSSSGSSLLGSPVAVSQS